MTLWKKSPMKQIVQDYQLIRPIAQGDYRFTGNSVGCKPIVAHLFGDRTAPRTLLDIGFGVGDLARIVKTGPDTSHWQVDGIDGFQDACCNEPLFDKRWYRNVWHGLAQELPAEQLRGYDAICLFDVIEHLDAPAAKALLTHLLNSLGDDCRLVISTPLWFWPQAHHHADDLEEHLIAVPAQSLFGLLPVMFHVHSEFLVGTFAFTRRSLPLVDRFVPTTDRSFGLEAGRANLQAIGHKADNVLYFAA
jgi:hypothetical protein